MERTKIVQVVDLLLSAEEVGLQWNRGVDEYIRAHRRRKTA